MSSDPISISIERQILADDWMELRFGGGAIHIKLSTAYVDGYDWKDVALPGYLRAVNRGQAALFLSAIAQAYELALPAAPRLPGIRQTEPMVHSPPGAPGGLWIGRDGSGSNTLFELRGDEDDRAELCLPSPPERGPALAVLCTLLRDGLTPLPFDGRFDSEPIFGRRLSLPALPRPDDALLAWVGRDSVCWCEGDQLHLRSLEEGVVQSTELGGNAWTVEPSPRGDRIAVLLGEPSRVRLLKVSDGSVRHLVNLLAGVTLRWSPSGGHLAAADTRSLRIFDAEGKRVAKTSLKGLELARWTRADGLALYGVSSSDELAWTTGVLEAGALRFDARETAPSFESFDGAALVRDLESQVVVERDGRRESLAARRPLEPAFPPPRLVDVKWLGGRFIYLESDMEFAFDTYQLAWRPILPPSWGCDRLRSRLTLCASDVRGVQIDEDGSAELLTPAEA